jgi:SAM-dependent methyltransferase
LIWAAKYTSTNSNMFAVDLFFVIFFALILIFACIHLYQEFTGRAPFIPISSRMIPDIISALELSEGSVLYDLGSGDGRVSRAIASQFPSVEVVGVERSFIPFVLSKLFSPNVPNLRFVRKDFFNFSFENATHIYLYLFPGVMPDLLKKFEKELKPGTRVISCDFTFPGKVPLRVIDLAGTHRSKYKLYVYEV